MNVETTSYANQHWDNTRNLKEETGGPIEASQKKIVVKRVTKLANENTSSAHSVI